MVDLLVNQCKRQGCRFSGKKLSTSVDENKWMEVNKLNINDLGKFFVDK